MPNLLSELAVKYGSDKWGPKHSYTAWYFEQFKDRRDSVRKVVEIGVGEGASLRMWAEFFPNAQIWGADNDWTRIFDDGRIRCELCDQSNAKSLDMLLAEVGTDIDLFIDDGSHRDEDQHFTCGYLMPLLDRCVTYVIEDVKNVTSLGLNTVRAGYEFEFPVLEMRQRYDNRLVIVRHAQG